MSNPHASAAAADHSAPEANVQQLIALLSSLMPLLQQYGWQAAGQPFQAGIGSFAIPNPMIDQQAAVNLARDITADSLRNLSVYLESHAEQHPALKSCVPIVTQAAHSFAAANYPETFNLIWFAYRTLAMIRASEPQLPPLRAGASQAGEPSDAFPSSIH
jgi:hypothetical protein